MHRRGRPAGGLLVPCTAEETTIDTAAQETVDLVQNEASRTRFDVPEPAPGR